MFILVCGVAEMALARLPKFVRAHVLDFLGTVDTGNDLELALELGETLGIGCAAVSEAATCKAADEGKLRHLREVHLVGRHGAGRLDALCRAVTEADGETSITEISIHDLRVNPEREKALLEKCKRLEKVSLRSVGLIQLSISRLATCIRELDLSENNLSNVESLRGISRLRSLNLNGNHVHESGAMALADLATQYHCLKRIYLARSQVGPEGARALLSCPNLEELDLSGNSLGRAGADHIVDVSSTWTLKKLWVSRNSLPGEAFENLRSWSTLEALDISHNHLGAEGGKSVIAADAPHLRELVLGHNQLGDLDETLSSPLLNLHHLDVQAAQYSSPEALAKFISGLAGAMLLDLNLAHCHIQGEEAAQAIASMMDHLQALHLTGNHIGDAGVRVIADALSDNSTLEVLNLEDCQVGPEGAMALALALQDNDTLEDLELRCNLLGNPGAEAFAPIVASQETNLRRLNLSFNDVTVESVSFFISAIEHSKLQYLGLADNFLSMDGFNQLKEAPRPLGMRVDLRSSAASHEDRVSAAMDRETVAATAAGIGAKASSSKRKQKKKKDSTKTTKTKKSTQKLKHKVVSI